MNTFRVSIPAPPPPVEPGSATWFTVEVRNQGSTVDRYRCETVGIDPTWVEVSPEALGLFPASSADQPASATDTSPTIGTFTVTVRPPRDSTAKAGTVAFGALVRSEQDPSNSQVEEGDLEILPFGHLGASLHPSVLIGRSAALAAIDLVNDGNRPEDVTVVASDPTERMSFSLEPPQVTVPSGEHASVRVRVSLGAPEVIGGTEGGPFTIEVRSKGRDVPPIVLQGTFQKRAILSRSVPTAIGGIVALALGAVLVWTAVRPPAPPPSAPPAATAAGAAAPTSGGAETPTAPPIRATPAVTAVPFATPVPPEVPDRLAVDDELFVNEHIVSANGVYEMTLRADGNLVLTRTDTSVVLWAPIKFQDVAAGYASMQSDGNFTLYEAKPARIDQVVWATGTFDSIRHVGAEFVLQNDGNLVLYWETGAAAKWSSKDDIGCQRECS